MPEPTKASRSIQRPSAGDIRRAVKALGINVPIYRVETITDGLRFHLYGHKKPVHWKRPKPRRTRKKAT